MEDIFDTRCLTMSILASPNMANFSGVVHGGELMKLLDQVAYACATRYCGHGVVTLSVDNLMFKHPIPIGSLITFLASVNYVGKTSCEVGIKVVSEDIKNHFVTHCNTCYFTMVAIDTKTGEKKAIPPFEPTTPLEIKRYEEALKRKKMREENAKILKSK